MSFLDKLKAKAGSLAKGFGDETVKVVPADEVPPAVVRTTRSSEDSAFHDDGFEQEFVDNQQKIHDEFMSQFADTDVPKVEGDRIQDVLDLLKIPPTFEIAPDVLMPDDFESEDFSFNLQMPQGYDPGQVDTFVRRSKKTVAYYVQLLTLRNQHVAQLATTVDRLQVDANNLRYQAEVASGVNIMPTEMDSQLENENYQLRMMNKRLEDEVRQLRLGGGAPSGDAERVQRLNEGLTDQLSVIRRKNEILTDENAALRDRIALYEDEQEISLDSTPPEDSAFTLPDLGEPSGAVSVDSPLPMPGEFVSRSDEPGLPPIKP